MPKKTKQTLEGLADKVALALNEYDAAKQQAEWGRLGLGSGWYRTVQAPKQSRAKWVRQAVPSAQWVEYGGSYWLIGGGARPVVRYEVIKVSSDLRTFDPRYEAELEEVAPNYHQMRTYDRGREVTTELSVWKARPYDRAENPWHDQLMARVDQSMAVPA